MEKLKLNAYAERAGVHPNTVHKWLREGRLTGQKVGKGWRIAEDAVPLAKGEKVEEKPTEAVVVITEPAKRDAEGRGGETYKELRAVVDNGDYTEEQAARLARMVENVVKADRLDVKKLAGDREKLEEQEMELAVREAGLEARDKELEVEKKRFSESWDNDMATLAEEKDEFEKAKERLKGYGELYNCLLRDMQRVKDYYLKARGQYPKLQGLMEPKFELKADWYNQLDDGRDGASDDIDQGGKKKVRAKPVKKEPKR